MEGWKLASIAAIAILAFAGMAFAAGGWRGNFMMGNYQNYSNGTYNGSGFARGHMAANGTNWNGTSFQPRGFGMGGRANQSFNKTEAASFQSAVLSGDFATAQQLHNEYGFGSPLFDRLNATTFAQVSQIANLQQQIAGIRKTLGQELGFNTGNTSAAPGMRAGAFGFNAINGNGIRMSRGGMRNVAYHQTPTTVPAQ